MQTPLKNSLQKSKNQLQSLPEISGKLTLGDAVEVKFDSNLSDADAVAILDVAKSLKPWRKGPFKLGGLFIDSEWRSNIKFDILAPHLDLKGKLVADVGCNNGYYMFRMLSYAPRGVVGFDPSERCKTQFDFINHFARTDIKFERLGVEDLPSYGVKFDTIFCLGVIYHRSDPVKMLKDLRAALESGGEVYLDTMYIEGDADVALSPRGTYSKIPNIYFVPTISALRNWCERAKFTSFEVLETRVTSEGEQRKTEWIDGQSLGDFLDPKDPKRTVEGYPAPRRVYVRIK